MFIPKTMLLGAILATVSTAVAGDACRTTVDAIAVADGSGCAGVIVCVEGPPEACDVQGDVQLRFQRERTTRIPSEPGSRCISASSPFAIGQARQVRVMVRVGEGRGRRLRTRASATCQPLPTTSTTITTTTTTTSTTAPGGSGGCVRTGCSGQLCADYPIGGTCEWLPEYACYRTATCERQANLQCAFTMTPELAACLESPPPN